MMNKGSVDGWMKGCRLCYCYFVVKSEEECGLQLLQTTDRAVEGEKSNNEIPRKQRDDDDGDDDAVQ
jgi:hypothetical protein